MIVLMAKTAETKKESYRTYMHHLAWSVVCGLLLMCIGALLIHAQILDSRAASLEQQLIAAKRPAPSTCRVDDKWQPNTTTVQTVGGRQFLVHTPVLFASNQYYPMTFVYPGKGGSAADAEVAYGLDSLPSIVVYPYPTVGKDGYLAWQGAPYSSGSDDVSFTSAIIDELQSELCIDRTKIYAIGMSNGGGFVSLLSCKLPEKFAAYAVVAGAMYSPGGQCKPPQPTPMLSIHGDKDPSVPYNGSPLRNLPAIDSWSAQRAAMNGCKSPITAAGNNINTVTTVWNDCKNNATVQNIRVKGGGHVWGDVTNDAIWQFLSRYSLR